MPVFRIRMTSGHEGRPHHYHHADVIARDGQAALRAAKMGRVENWRWIDTFDTASRTYCEYRVLGRVSLEDADRPEPPQAMKLWRLEQRLSALDGVFSARVQGDDADIWVRPSQRSRKLYRSVRTVVGDRNIRYFPSVKGTK